MKLFTACVSARKQLYYTYKVYAGLCAQRPPVLCWLHAQRPLSRSMLAFVPNNLLAYAGFTPNGLYQGLCWPLCPTTSWLMLASRSTASIKVYAGLCAQRPPGLCWLHAQWPSIKVYVVPNDLLVYAGFMPNGPLSRAFAPNDLLASRPSIKVYAGHRAQRPIGL